MKRLFWLWLPIVLYLLAISLGIRDIRRSYQTHAAACTGSGLVWSCPAGAAIADVQLAMSSATDGATITFANGSYNWSGGSIPFNPAKGLTLICASVGGCTVTATGTTFGMSTWSGTNTKLFRISGFVFPNCPDFLIWFGSGGNVVGNLTQVRIDNNNFQNAVDGAHIAVFGEAFSVVNIWGVVDHNTLTSATSTELIYGIAATQNNPPALQLGTINNMFAEDNTITVTTMTDAGLGCIDGWGSFAIVWRHNTTLNCLVTTHGVTHSGGPDNVELYNNALAVNSNASGFTDGYRLFHHQGSNTFVGFNNTFTAVATLSTSAMEVIHYRDYCPTSIDGGLPCCDGTQSIDGNRIATTTYRGYPCWRQPGRDPATQNLVPMYIWNNQNSADSSKVDMASPDYNASSPDYQPQHMISNRDWFNAVSASAQTTSSSPFNGTTGMGFGTLVNRPSTCSTALTDTGDAGHGGVGYFATNDGPMGTLYTCTATNTWTKLYSPFTYPHPLVSGGATLPSVNTAAASSITQTTATSGGTVGSDGGASVASRGTCYAVTLNPTSPCTSDGSGTGAFTSSLTGLTPGTIYHTRAFATNSVGTAYGADVAFTTLPPSPQLPTVTTTAASGITQTTAAAGGNVTSDGGASVTSRGTCYAVTAAPTSPCTSDGSGIGTFTSNLAGLSASTTYHIRAFATNSVGTAYGSDLTFTTLAPVVVLPTVTTTAASNIQQTTATAGGNVTNSGGATISARGTCYATTVNPTSPCTSDGTGTGSFTSSITGLSASTTYFIRAFATNSAGTAYGSNLTFTTQAPTPVVPTVTTTTATAITQTTASAGGVISSDGGASVTARGTCYATTASPTSPCTSDGTGIGSFTSSISGLTASTTYFYRAFATNSAGTAYGANLQFTTLTPAPVLPTVTTTAASLITQTTASTGGNVSSDGGAAVTSRGVCYATTAFPTSPCTSNGTGTGVFASSLTGLTAQTLYHIRAFAVNSVGTAYGSDLTFTTLNPPVILPTVGTTPASSIGLTTATAGGNVTSDGGGAVTARGTCYATTANPTSPCTSDGTGTGSFTSSLTGLSNSTLYHIRAFATNSTGTAYGTDLTFTTQTPAPTIPVVSTTIASAIGQTTATAGGTIASDGGASVTSRGTCYAVTANPTSPCTSDGTGIGAFTSSITGLTAATQYHYRAFATNSVGTAYGSDFVLTTLTPSPVLPTLTTTAATQITQTTAVSGGTITSDGGATVTARGVCYSTSAAPTSPCTSDGSGVGAFISSITGLTANTLYHVRSFATNSVGTAYGSDLTFTTSAVVGPSGPVLIIMQ